MPHNNTIPALNLSPISAPTSRPDQSPGVPDTPDTKDLQERFNKIAADRNPLHTSQTPVPDFGQSIGIIAGEQGFNMAPDRNNISATNSNSGTNKILKLAISLLDLSQEEETESASQSPKSKKDLIKQLAELLKESTGQEKKVSKKQLKAVEKFLKEYDGNNNADLLKGLVNAFKNPDSVLKKKS